LSALTSSRERWHSFSLINPDFGKERGAAMLRFGNDHTLRTYRRPGCFGAHAKL